MVPHVWPTSALALVDGQTKALTLAAQVTANPGSPWSGLIVVSRPDEPFTPAESARAHRLAEVAVSAAAMVQLREAGVVQSADTGRQVSPSPNASDSRPQ